MRLLLVEDSARLRRSLEAGLSKAGFSVESVPSAEEGGALLRCNPFDLVILDVMLPGMDGLTLLRETRGSGADVPVLLLTARDSTEQVVEGFDAGADDYLVKPFAFDELLVRCRALLRRRYGAPHATHTAGGLVLDATAQTVTVDGERVEITARDYKVLEVLTLRAGEVVRREELEDHVYRLSDLPNSNAIDAAIYALRRKIDGGKKPSRIKTVRGLGYTLDPERSSADGAGASGEAP